MTKQPLSTARVRAQAERLMAEFSREEYLVSSGQKAKPAFEEVLGRYAEIMGRDALTILADAFFRSPPGSEEQRQTRLLLGWHVQSLSIQDIAPIVTQALAWQARARIQVPNNGELPYHRAAIDIANEANAAKRAAIDDARARLCERELAPLKREIFQRECASVENLELASDYIRTWELLKGISLDALSSECEAFLRGTEDLWADTRAEVVTRRLGIDPTRATRADALALAGAPEFDPFFPRDEMQARIFNQIAEMGIDPTARGRIIVDSVEREGKRGRGFCAPVRVPDEVYVVIRPRIGQEQWSHFLHELGHGLHFAYTAKELPFEHRRLGDVSVTESYASLFDHLLHDERWLRRYSDIGSRSRDFVRWAAFEELLFVRRYCGKLLYEMELYGGQIAWEDLPARYVEIMTVATKFQHRTADAFVEPDIGLVSPYYLRARQLQFMLTESLTRQFGEEWWANPAAGPWIVEQLFSHGSREDAGELAARVVNERLSFAPLTQSLEKRLA